ncbi:hypothetical protein NDU88_002556 [Pleurodeles waltl]|uniref:Uncharacterized protein n=1 Tax=Pleurodeles waltl TaxID=8319 RepID=A0AAV7W264_PLEWA|nr:hypothetical protein NDU88_002556 [Pleurodeles waltl]
MQGPGGMALTNEDLLASLCTFKAELREELTADLKSALEALQSDVTSRMTSLQADVDSVGTHTLELETQVQEIKQRWRVRWASRRQVWPMVLLDRGSRDVRRSPSCLPLEIVVDCRGAEEGPQGVVCELVCRLLGKPWGAETEAF